VENNSSSVHLSSITLSYKYLPAISAIRKGEHDEEFPKSPQAMRLRDAAGRDTCHQSGSDEQSENRLDHLDGKP
jgi:hypothetical protein